MTRTITDPSELDALPPWAVVEDAHRIAWVNHPVVLGRPDHWVSFYGDRMSARSVSSYAPVTVLHDPSASVVPVVSDAAVEAAARAMAGVVSVGKDYWRATARLALRAALPHLAAVPSATREDVIREALDAYRAEVERASRSGSLGAPIALLAGSALADAVEAAITPRTDR